MQQYLIINRLYSFVCHLSSVICRLLSVVYRLSSVFCFLSSVLTNKPNFRKSQMNVNLYNTTDYENKSNWTLGQNKPNSNPIKPNFKKAKMNVNSIITKDYRKKDDFAVRKNKPNSNPISVKPKMDVNLYVIEDYENETTLRPQKNKPNQSQSLVKDLIALVNAWKTVKKSCGPCRAVLQSFQENFDKPGERKAECSARPKLRTDPMNLLGIMPAKEGKIDLKHSFYGSAFCFEFYKTGPRL